MSISSVKCVSALVYFIFFIILTQEILYFNANRVDPDQMPHSAASDPGPHCLLMAPGIQPLSGDTINMNGLC